VHIDFPTVFLTTGFVTEVAGLLLLFSWLQDRRSTSLAYWGLGYVIGGIGGILFAARASIPMVVAINFGGAITMLAFGLMWSGARSFEGRRPNVLLAISGAALWFVLATAGFFDTHIYARISVASFTIIFYLLLTVREYWHARDKELRSRWPAMVLLLAQVGFFVIRLLFAERLPFPGGVTHYAPGLLPYGIFVLLLNNFCIPFLIMNMAKERLERDQRRIALIDSLTGIANRRAFLDRGERILQRIAVDRGPVALLLIDLDMFKQVNDTFGHQAGDQVLCAFCEVTGAALRPNDMLGRMGGEEFACLLPGTSAGEAAVIAERIRMRFGAHPTVVEAGEVRTTVSIGIATANDTGYSLNAMFAGADRALYQAKAKGRNRIERAWPAATDPLKTSIVPAAVA
jgi:diguanylate cyclase (GGDEF)-like protein